MTWLISVGVARFGLRAGEDAPAGVHDHRHAAFGAQVVDRVHVRGVGAEAAVHRVDLDRDRAQVELAFGFGGRGRVHGPGSRWRPGGTGAGLYAMIGSRSSTGWIAGRPRAVLGEQQGHVDAFGRPAGRRAGPGPDRRRRRIRRATPESLPKSAAHCIHAGVTVLSLGTCMWASTTAMPSITGRLPVQPRGCPARRSPARKSAISDPSLAASPPRISRYRPRLRLAYAGLGLRSSMPKRCWSQMCSEAFSGYGATSGGSSKMRVVRRPGAYGGQPGSPSAANAAHCERIRSPRATALAGGSGPNSIRPMPR